MAISDKEWNQRKLCSDGNCIGIIGSDGCCKECGRAYDGKLPVPDEEEPTAAGDVDVVDTEPETAPGDDAEEDRSAEADASGGDWKDRTLCIDGNCIGVIGSDGCCKVCGKTHPGKQS